MNKGFTLIETIIYTCLLSVIITGIFSSILFFINNNIENSGFSDEDYKELILNYHE